MLERLTDHQPSSAAEGPTRQRLWKVRAKQVVLATGAIERPLVFAGNDRPGIMLTGAVRSYVNRYGVLPGDRAVLFTNNDGAYAAAPDPLAADRKSVVVGKSVSVRVDLVGLRCITKKKKK